MISARALLDIDAGEILTDELIRSAFGKAVRACHPDTSGGSSTRSIEALKAAREKLLAEVTHTQSECLRCKGSGRMMAYTMRGALCPACSGTGIRYDLRR
jgi:hypothetical protein